MSVSPSPLPRLSCEDIETHVADIISALTRLIAESKDTPQGGDGCREQAHLCRAKKQEERFYSLIDRYALLRSAKDTSHSGPSDSLGGHTGPSHEPEQRNLCTPLRNEATPQAHDDGNSASPAPRLPVRRELSDSKGKAGADSPERKGQSKGLLVMRGGRQLRPEVSAAFSQSMEQLLLRCESEGVDDHGRHPGLLFLQPARHAADGDIAAPTEEGRQQGGREADNKKSDVASLHSSTPTGSPVTVSPFTAAVGGHENVHLSSGFFGSRGRTLISVPSFTMGDATASSDAAASAAVLLSKRSESDVSPLTTPLTRGTPASPVPVVLTTAVAAPGVASDAEGRQVEGPSPATSAARLNAKNSGSTHKPKVLSLERAMTTTALDDLATGASALHKGPAPLTKSLALAREASGPSGSLSTRSPRMRTARSTHSIHTDSSRPATLRCAGSGVSGGAPPSLPGAAVSSSSSLVSFSLSASGAALPPPLPLQGSRVSDQPAHANGNSPLSIREGSVGRGSGRQGWREIIRSSGSIPSGGGDERRELALLRRLVATRRDFPGKCDSYFRPSPLALSCELASTSPPALQQPTREGDITRMRIGVSTAPVPPRAKGFFAKDRRLREEQSYLCKDCLNRLTVQCGSRTRGGLPSWDSAQYCYYTGCYYCLHCHGGRRRPIPADLLHHWDGTPRPVCARAADFLAAHFTAPLWCVGAVSPWLIAQVPSLREAHALRVQLAAMRDTGIRCHRFRHLFFGEEDAEQSQRQGGDVDGERTWGREDGCTIPPALRYYVEDTELWSLGDLVDLHDCCPVVCAADAEPCGVRGSGGEASDEEVFAQRASSLSRAHEPFAAAVSTTKPDEALDSGAAAGFPPSTLLSTLRVLRRWMAAHLLSCKDCRRRSTDVCRLCCPADSAEAFTVALLSEEEEENDDDEAGGAHQQRGGGPSGHAASFLDSIPIAAHRCLVHSFDVLHVHQCQRCRCCYHKDCIADISSAYTRQVCGVCATLQLAAATAAPSEDSGEHAASVAM